jgi:hypothetical protein
MNYIVALNLGLTVYIFLNYREHRNEYRKVLEAQNAIMEALIKQRGSEGK